MCCQPNFFSKKPAFLTHDKSVVILIANAELLYRTMTMAQYKNNPSIDSVDTLNHLITQI